MRVFETVDEALDEVEWLLSKFLGPINRATIAIKALRDDRIPPDEFTRERTRQAAKAYRDGEGQA